MLNAVADNCIGKPGTLNYIIENKLELVKYKSFVKVKYKKRCIEGKKLSELQTRKCTLLAEESTEAKTLEINC